MTELGLRRAVFGSLIFFCLAPGTAAGLVPYLISHWHLQTELPMTARVLGVIGTLVGLLSLIESFARFVSQGHGTPAPIAPPTHLVVSGQYRYVRNPMYAALVLIVAGQALWFGSPGVLVYALVLWALFHIRVLTYEEPTLATTFGAHFDDYRRNVRRWIPRITPWRAA